MAAAGLALVLASPAYAFQQTPQAPPALTAEAMIARQETALERSLGIGCIREEGEITVCAPLNRGGIPYEKVEGERVRLIAGEVNPAGPISELGSCCGPRGGLDVIKMGKVAGKIIGKIF
jgi:hypothetical protein